MIIEEISIRGYKSFGNTEQVVKFNTESGELILLCGSNGSGKSSILECVEYALYGKVKSMKNKKWTKASLLPNRINGELLNKIKFKSSGSEIEVVRGISPNILKVLENGLEIDKAGKASLDERIEKLVGIDIETFKSFISLSINDFKNFISLSSEEKKLLLDKLFNLEVINILSDILKELNKTNKIGLARLDAEIGSLASSIRSIDLSIQKALEREKEDLDQEISVLNSEIEKRKEEYKLLREKKDKISLKENEINTHLDKEKEELYKIKNNLGNVDREIGLYNSGKCPTCKVSFDGQFFSDLRNELEQKKIGVEKILEQITGNITALGEKKKKLAELSSEVTTSFNDLTYLLRNYKAQIDQLNAKKNSGASQNHSTQEFENTKSELLSKMDIVSGENVVLQEKEVYYKELSKILSEDGVKKSIISKIIEPINHFVAENLRKMRIPFQVVLDQNFNAEIKNLNEVIEQDSLSTGENKRINICIMIAYLKMIRTKRHINILFLDEVFSSIDLEGIESILLLLKDFANNYKISIFVVHHALMSGEFFDRIISVNKDVFSQITETATRENG